jgi:hypothetical protein
MYASRCCDFRRQKYDKERMRGVSTMQLPYHRNTTHVVQVIIGATGTIPKSFRKYLSNITGKHEIKELHRTAILGTAHTLLKVQGGSNMTGTICV